MWRRVAFIGAIALLVGGAAGAQTAAVVGGNEVGFRLSLEGQSFTRAVNIFLLLTALSLAPSFILMMTSFTRIVIVIGFLKQALGVQQAPSGRIVASLALFLTFFIMQPTWNAIYQQAVLPFSKGEITEGVALEKAGAPLHRFMLAQTREASLAMFMDLAGLDPASSEADIPLRVVVPAFMVSELQTAYQMGFLIYLPFLVIDAVVATFLMSLGMMMLPPTMVSLPLKLLLFVMVDGWDLVVRGLVASFVV
ncbi:MAG: flagellar biosynthetic protein FliP [Lentisphaerae bacterium RIFOXYB12_FULL_65_16]|nr:MAG: flagellar biosynthetic protein FliP [Lentisphaerae bacterium RIFOXYA12_64_32]OGV88908.1 MAG: flagellar biosynthetic protein FliP [Lentisphaerae bacterium RIFOXYB12_FULL_65_16]